MPQANTRYRERIYSSYLTAGDLGPGEHGELRKRAPFFRKAIRNYLPPNRDAAIIDIGCGHGGLLYFAQQAGYRNIKGVDLSAEQVAVAHRLGIEGVSQGDLFGALRNLRPESLEAIVTIDVVEHLRKDELLDLTDEIFRVLRKNGRWIVHAPNGESPFFGRIRYGDFTHELAFTRTSVEQIALASGFSKVRCFEDTPIPHGLTSSIRWLLWKVIRSILRAWLVIETGSNNSACLLTQNFFVTIDK